MNAHRLAYSLAFAMLAAPAAALACTDGGPPNRACNDGGAQWISCTDHAQCPEGQYCSERGACDCGGRDAGVCDDSGCHGCHAWSFTPDSGPDSGLNCSIRPAFVCPDPTATDAAVDTGTAFDVVTVDVRRPSTSVGAGGGGGGGCAVRAPSDRAASSPLAVLAALVGIAALARVRRR